MAVERRPGGGLLDARYSSSVWYRDFEANAVLYNPTDGRSFYVSTTATF